MEISRHVSTADVTAKAFAEGKIEILEIYVKKDSPA